MSRKAERVASGIALVGAAAAAIFAGLVACKVQPFIVPKEQFTLAVALLAGATLALAVIGCVSLAVSFETGIERNAPPWTDIMDTGHQSVYLSSQQSKADIE